MRISGEYMIRRAANAVRRFQNAHLRGERRNYPAVVAVGGPNEQTISFVKTTESRVIAEIGIYQGHTSLEFARFLNGRGELHLFDFADRVSAVQETIRKSGYSNITTHGSSYKLLDSYNWSLARLIETQRDPIFDYVFLDGAHTFAVDALTFFLADKLLKPGGYMDFDDYDWTLDWSPSLNPRTFPLTAKCYTDEQIKTPQVQMIIDLCVRRDPHYTEIVPNKIFRKS
jgi:predicted O-methyltransferase YrrM